MDVPIKPKKEVYASKLKASLENYFLYLDKYTSHGAEVEVKRCSADDCNNQAVKGGVCKRHGAEVEVKRCSADDCNNQAVKGGVCKRHGAEVKRCSADGCPNQVQKGGVCVKHGANRCSSEGGNKAKKRKTN